MRFVLLSSLVFVSSFSYATPLLACADRLRSPDDPRWFDVSQALTLIDFAAAIEFSANAELPQLSSPQIARSVPARIKVLRGVWAQAAHIQSGQVFLAYFEFLKSLPREILFEREKVDGARLRRYLAQLKGTIVNRYAEGFDLTLVTLANRHPLMILRDPRVIPHLARIFLGDYETSAVISPMITNESAYRARWDKTLTRLKIERAQLLSGHVLASTITSKRAEDLWRKSFVEASQNAHDLDQAIQIAAGLGVELFPKRKKARNF